MRCAKTMPVGEMRRGNARPLHNSSLETIKAPSDYRSSSEGSDSESDPTYNIPPEISNSYNKVRSKPNPERGPARSTPQRYVGPPRRQQ